MSKAASSVVVQLCGEAVLAAGACRLRPLLGRRQLRSAVECNISSSCHVPLRFALLHALLTAVTIHVFLCTFVACGWPGAKANCLHVPP